MFFKKVVLNIDLSKYKGERQNLQPEDAGRDRKLSFRRLLIPS
jgi:hypothetical protein